MMRSWGNRSDTIVVDEPFYAHFLHHTGLDHPMREQVIATGEIRWQVVAEQMQQRPDEGIFYQKHIATHWLEHFTHDWLYQLEHVFLIREPEPVVASYANKREAVTASDVGYAQQAALFDIVTQQQGSRPLVIDSKRFLADPSSQLKSICAALAIPFEPAMLSWPAGPQASDGVWGAHWYDAVNQSTGFSAARSMVPELDAHQRSIAQSCRPFYEAMAQYAL